MNKKTTTFLITIALQSSLFVYSQASRKDSITNYFKQIRNLIENKDLIENKILFEETLLEKRRSEKGEEKVKTLLNLYSFYKYKNFDEALKHNNEAIDLAKSIGYKRGELQASQNKAYLFFTKGHFDEATKILDSISQPKNDILFPNIYSDITCLKSIIHTERGEYPMALDVALRLLDFGEKSANDSILMKSHGSLMHYYLRKENYSKALYHCFKGLEYTIKIREIQFFYFKVDEIARILSKLGDINGALNAYSFYLELEKKINPPGDYIRSVVYMNMADIFTSGGQFEEAQNYLTESLNLNYRNKYRFRIPRALILQAALYLKKKDTTNAIFFYEKSLNAAEDINAFDVIKSTSKILAELYFKKGEFSKSSEYLSLHNSIKDSLFSNEKEQKISILEARRKIKEITRNQEIMILENKAQRNKIQSIILVLLCIMLVAICIILAYLKVKDKNKLLYTRTIELAKSQLEMSDKIDKLESLKGAKDNDDKANENLSKSNSVIDENTRNIILDKLNKLEQGLFFIDQHCTLNKIAQQLKTNPKYLSLVINQEKKSNFNNYINELRINYLLAKLLKDKDFRESKLTYISASIGYNNLNTFNAAFKKRQGILPSYFIKTLIQESK